MGTKSKMKSRATTKKRPKKVREFRRILVRVPDDLADWLDASAAELGYSRDAFLRSMLVGYREGLKLAERPDGASLFVDIRERATQIASDAMERAVRDVIARADIRSSV